LTERHLHVGTEHAGCHRRAKLASERRDERFELGLRNLGWRGPDHDGRLPLRVDA
jgi:hypothetical protein